MAQFGGPLSLHDLQLECYCNRALTATAYFNSTTVYHILCRDHLLTLQHGQHEAARAELAQLFDRLKIRDRQFDSIPVGSDLPEEYCYALNHQGRRPVLTQQNLNEFFRFARKVQFVQDPRRPLLLKNPYDITNFLFLQRVFPTAKFLFIHRDPVRVIDSQIRMIHAVIARRHEYEALLVYRVWRMYENPVAWALARLLYLQSSPLLYWQVARSVARSCDYATAHFTPLGERAICLTYGTLCQHPAGCLRRILHFLELPESARHGLYSADSDAPTSTAAPGSQTPGRDPATQPRLLSYVWGMRASGSVAKLESKTRSERTRR